MNQFGLYFIDTKEFVSCGSYAQAFKMYLDVLYKAIDESSLLPDNVGIAYFVPERNRIEQVDMLGCVTRSVLISKEEITFS